MAQFTGVVGFLPRGYGPQVAVARLALLARAADVRGSRLRSAARAARPSRIH
ncbi:hypothetical protein [Streptomyces sp. CO7]